MKRVLLLCFTSAAVACGDTGQGVPAATTTLSPEGAQDYAASMSPDGKYVAFWRRGEALYDLWVADADLRDARTLGVSSALVTVPPIWSTDGARLLVSSSATSVSDIAIVDVATGAVTNLTDSPALQIPTGFHPDGDRVAFAAYAEGGTVRTFLVSMTTGEVAAMVPGVDGPHIGIVSPDGAHLVYNVFEGGSADIWVSAADGGQRRQLTSDGYAGIGWLSRPSAWSPDGRSFLYVSTRTGKPDIWLGSVDGTTRQLTADINGDEFPAWSPDGRWVAFVSQRGRQTDIWVVPSEGGEARRVTDDVLEEGAPTWLDDSTLVYNTGDQRGTYWRRSINDTVETQVLPDSLDAAGFTESPDRSWLAFLIAHPGGSGDLAVVRPDGSGLRVLSRDAWHDNVVWDPTSTRLAWTTNQAGNLDVFFADLAGDGAPSKVDGWPGSERPAYWTSDGTGLVIVADRESRLGDLWRIPLGPGDTTRLTRLGSVVEAGAVVADGQDQVFVLVPDDATGELVVAALLPNDRLRPLVSGIGVVRPINRLLASAVFAGQVITVVYRYDGTVLHRLEGVGSPTAFSMDDSKLLIQTQGDQSDIAMFDVATGELIRLTNTPEDETNMVFTAAGDSIVFRRTRITSALVRADVSRVLR